MKRFAQLYTTLDQTTKTNAKIEALAGYFDEAPAADAAWAIWFLCGGKLKRLIPTKLLRQWSAEVADIESWMFDECYDIVGDLAELMALILPPPQQQSDDPLNVWVTDRLEELRDRSKSDQRALLVMYWDRLEEAERFVMHKLITGSFRVGVSKRLVVQGLSKQGGIAPEVLSHRLMGVWEPTAENFRALLDPDTHDTQVSQPYPFFLAHPLEKEPTELGEIADWQAEWKWDGIRAQVIRREGQTFIWSRGEDLMTDRFPEIVTIAESLDDGTVIDGEIVAMKDGKILPFSEMQRRIGRKKLGPKILSDVPVAMIAFDLLEFEGNDVRQHSLDWRREHLAVIVDSLTAISTSSKICNQPANNLPSQKRFAFVADSESESASQLSIRQPTIQLSEVLHATTWQELTSIRSRSREHQTEGVILKRRGSRYQVGRPRGDWWKWKVEPYTIDCVLIYAQRGHGRRASLYTDYTFAVWSGEELVPFAKAYSGLTDAEIRKVDRFVRNNTVEQFGPVRSVTPELVFELAFENIQLSTRHKSGIAVRFPRIARWRDDLKIEDADSLETIRAMMNAETLDTQK